MEEGIFKTIRAFPTEDPVQLLEISVNREL